MKAAIDKSVKGQEHGRWTIVGAAFNAKLTASATKKKCVVVQCSCGERRVSYLSDVSGGRSQSCGCLAGEIRAGQLRKHGHRPYGRESRTYCSWRAMISRCCNKNDTRYKDWGGRGITVCERWTEFSNFLSDMGERPIGTTLDRIDNEKNYCPENCRWATNIEQQHNKRKTQRWSGETIPCLACGEPGIVVSGIAVPFCQKHRPIMATTGEAAQ